MSRTREYAGSVSLLITGKSVDPAAVTRVLGLAPFQCWRAGELKRVRNATLQSRNTDGGWKGVLPGATKRSSLESQLKRWVSILRRKVRPIQSLKAQGHYCRLSWFAATGETVSLVIPSDLQSELASLGLDWEISVWVTQENP